ncbi:hypothetical protein K7X08_032300 [Anisodus acutangulus]|uniref:Ubiquitin-like protease family profile domain-containing protein n=1 Tax=Anisodus acutangulus TaxID=402998 RepID=A0A9Q1LK32_9SOLA|nr:hypothetical protein K7X08_032300 [Anisodus acutangulus]
MIVFVCNDCGVLVACFAEYLIENIEIIIANFDIDGLPSRYGEDAFAYSGGFHTDGNQGVRGVDENVNDVTLNDGVGGGYSSKEVVGSNVGDGVGAGVDGGLAKGSEFVLAPPPEDVARPQASQLTDELPAEADDTVKDCGVGPSGQVAVLGCLSILERCFCFYDSMRSTRHANATEQAIEAYRVLLPLFLNTINFYTGRNDIVLENDLPPDHLLSDPLDVNMVETLPKQRNIDCGVFVACFAEYLIENIEIIVANFDIDGLPSRYGEDAFAYSGGLHTDGNQGVRGVDENVNDVTLNDGVSGGYSSKEVVGGDVGDGVGGGVGVSEGNDSQSDIVFVSRGDIEFTDIGNEYVDGGLAKGSEFVLAPPPEDVARPQASQLTDELPAEAEVIVKDCGVGPSGASSGPTRPANVKKSPFVLGSGLGELSESPLKSVKGMSALMPSITSHVDYKLIQEFSSFVDKDMITRLESSHVYTDDDDHLEPRFNFEVSSAIEAYRVLLPLFLNTINFYTGRNDIVLENDLPPDHLLSDPLDVNMVETLPKQRNIDCGVFVACFAEYLIENIEIIVANFDIDGLPSRYGGIVLALWEAERVAYGWKSRCSWGDENVNDVTLNDGVGCGYSSKEVVGGDVGDGVGGGVGVSEGNDSQSDIVFGSVSESVITTITQKYYNNKKGENEKVPDVNVNTQDLVDDEFFKKLSE